MREALAMNQQIVAKLSDLERWLETHDIEIQELVEALRELMAPLPANHRRIGFEAPSESTKKSNPSLRIHVVKPPKRK
jgi:hypothetical protein